MSVYNNSFGRAALKVQSSNSTAAAVSPNRVAEMSVQNKSEVLF